MRDVGLDTIKSLVIQILAILRALEALQARSPK
jgi:hypothetical protein